MEFEIKADTLANEGEQISMLAAFGSSTEMLKQHNPTPLFLSELCPKEKGSKTQIWLLEQVQQSQNVLSSYIDMDCFKCERADDEENLVSQDQVRVGKYRLC